MSGLSGVAAGVVGPNSVRPGPALLGPTGANGKRFQGPFSSSRFEAEDVTPHPHDKQNVGPVPSADGRPLPAERLLIFPGALAERP